MYEDSYPSPDGRSMLLVYRARPGAYSPDKAIELHTTKNLWYMRIHHLIISFYSVNFVTVN